MREHDRTRQPLRWFRRAELQPGEAVQAAHQESTQVRHEGAGAWFLGEPFAAELIGFGKRIFDEIGIALLEPVERARSVAQPCRVGAQQRREHGITDEFVDALQVELDRPALQGFLDGVVEREQSRERFRRRSRDAPVRR